MPRLTVGYLYPSVMCHYGDRGNVICLTKRCEWRGIDVEIQHLERGDPVDPDRVDLFLMGGGADSHQRLIAEDMVKVKGEAVKAAIEEGAAALMVCGGYQLWGEFYRAYDGTELPGLGMFPSYTIHRAHQLGSRLRSISDARAVRSVGNLAVQWEDRTLIGFENHGGRTYLRPGAQALGRVLAGQGNNSEDGWEGLRLSQRDWDLSSRLRAPEEPGARRSSDRIGAAPARPRATARATRRCARAQGARERAAVGSRAVAAERPSRATGGQRQSRGRIREPRLIALRRLP